MYSYFRTRHINTAGFAACLQNCFVDSFDNKWKTLIEGKSVAANTVTRVLWSIVGDQRVIKIIWIDAQIGFQRNEEKALIWLIYTRDDD